MPCLGECVARYWWVSILSRICTKIQVPLISFLGNTVTTPYEWGIKRSTSPIKHDSSPLRPFGLPYQFLPGTLFTIFGKPWDIFEWLIGRLWAISGYRPVHFGRRWTSFSVMLLIYGEMRFTMGLVLREKGDEARLIVKLEVIWISQGVIIRPAGNIGLESFFSHIPEFEFKKNSMIIISRLYY